jgi:hypothetical protein
MPNTKRTQLLHGCGSVRGGARQLASLPRRVRLLHLLTAGIGTPRSSTDAGACP